MQSVGRRLRRAVPVSAGEVFLSVSGERIAHNVVAGEFASRFSQQKHTLMNTGEQPFHAVAVLIK